MGRRGRVGDARFCWRGPVLICLRRVRPRLSALGSLLSLATFLLTLSFLITTPHVLAPDNPFGGFLMKDLILLGAALYTAAEALAADARLGSAVLPPHR